MPVATAAFLVALAVPILGQMSTAAGGRAEVAVGSAPQVQGMRPEATYTLELRPEADLTYVGERSLFTLNANERIYYRAPNIGDLARPLFLTRASADHGYQVTPTLTWVDRASFNIGEVDYVNAGLAFQGAPLTQQQLPVLQLWSGEARTGFEWRVGPRYELRTSGFVSRSEGFADSSEVMPKTTTLGVEQAHRYRLDEQSTGFVQVRPYYSRVDPGTDWLLIPLELGYERQLDARARCDLLGGAVLARPDVNGARFFPRAQASCERVLESSSRGRIVNRVGLGLDAVLDATVGEVRPLVTVMTTLRGELGHEWALVLAANIGAATERTHAPAATDTAVSASTAVSYSPTPELSLDLGGRFISRGSYLFADDYQQFIREGWIFLGITGVFPINGDSPRARR